MMKKRLFIIGAGSFGRELESWLSCVPLGQRDWELIGYIDSFQEPGSLKFPSEFKILGDEVSYQFGDNDYALIAVANSVSRERIYNAIRGRVKISQFIFPGSFVGKYNEIGEGVIICPNVVITTNVKIGLCGIVNVGSQIGHDVQVGDFSSLMANVDIAGNCNIGRRCLIGSNAVIIPGRKIADDTTVGAGSVVVRNIGKTNCTVFGNPAKFL
jgi:sugar O-acyltransferase (sialic acid O-acetyltransferase NeuD family)